MNTEHCIYQTYILHMNTVEWRYTAVEIKGPTGETGVSEPVKTHCVPYII